MEALVELESGNYLKVEVLEPLDILITEIGEVGDTKYFFFVHNMDFKEVLEVLLESKKKELSKESKEVLVNLIDVS